MSFHRPLAALGRAISLLTLLLGALAIPGQAQQATDPAVRLQSYEAHVAMAESSPFRNHPWQFIGPTNVSGRMTDVAVVTPKGESYTMYVAGAVGGVRSTGPAGASFTP